MKLKSTLVLVCVALACLSFSGCHKDVEDPNNIPTGTLMLHLHNYIGSQEVDAYNITYTTDEGRKISFSIAQYYLSDIRLVKADGSIYSVGDTVLLKVLEKEAYLVARVPAGDYKSIRFRVGLDSLTNLRTPPAGSVLNRSEMWFDNNAQPEGYVYLNLQGAIDTTDDATGTDMRPFVYRIGTNKHYTNVEMPDRNFSISPNQSQFIHIYADVMKLFNGINLADPTQRNINTVWDNNSLPAATTVSNNIPGMFIYE